jgi:probable DNA metabolism protein
MKLVYDGSFEGFLSLVYEVYYKKIAVESISKTIPDTLFLDDIIHIETDNEKAQKVLDSLKTKFTKKYFEDILVVFMCDSKSFEKDLLEFIILGFKDNKNLENITFEAVFAIQGYIKEYFRHHHKLTGFTRFVELEDGTLYAKLESKFNNLYHLGKFFLKRFNNQKYIIHDINRKLAFVKMDGFTGVQEVSDFDIPTLSKNEEKFSKLWKRFFKSVAIKERENKKVQRNFVPLLYRTYMNEFED